MPKVSASCRTHASEFAAAGSPAQIIPAAAHAVSQLSPSEETFQCTSALPHVSASGGGGAEGGSGGSDGGASWQGQKRA